ncbi:hypothetical protein ACFLYD_03235 [Chloroflexota bacterium]
MAAESSTRTPRDRWADWAVVGVLVVALLLGWGVKTLAEGRRHIFTDGDTGLTVQYPPDWLMRTNEDSVFYLLSPGSGEFKTTYQVRVQPIGATGDMTSTLVMVLNNASLVRAQELTACRLFDRVPGREIDGQPSMEASYACVHESSDLFTEQMPVVVQGLDVAVASGDEAYVFTLMAAQDVFDDAERAFRHFVESAELQ